jgi:hypothetical protein
MSRDEFVERARTLGRFSRREGSVGRAEGKGFRGKFIEAKLDHQRMLVAPGARVLNGAPASLDAATHLQIPGVAAKNRKSWFNWKTVLGGIGMAALVAAAVAEFSLTGSPGLGTVALAKTGVFAAVSAKTAALTTIAVTGLVAGAIRLIQWLDFRTYHGLW